MGAASLGVAPLLAGGWLDLRSALLFSILLFALQLFAVVKSLDRRAFRGLVAWVGGSVALIVAIVAVGERVSLLAMAEPLARLMLAWAFVLTLVPAAFDDRSPRVHLPMNAGVLAAGAAVFWLACARATGGIRPYIVDEVLYLLQAQHAWHPPFMQSLDPQLARFFSLQQAYVRGGYLNGQYPPGWPIVLAWFPGAGGHWLLLVGLHAGLVAATYTLGRLLVSRGAALLGAALVALNGMELFYSMSFFSEVFTATLLTAAAALLICGFRTARREAQLGCWAAAGFLIAWAGATRPLTGLALGAAIVLFVLLLERPSRQGVVQAGAVIAAGAAFPLIYLFWYNLSTTGSPLRFGYTLAERGFQALGFGTRGFVRYGSDGLPFLDVSRFGAHEAAVHAARGLRRMLAVFWPASLVLPLVFLALHLGARIRWRLVAPFALLPVAYFFYFFAGVRFVFELLPFAMVATAWLAVRVWDRRPLAALAVAALLLASTAAAIPPWLAPRGNLAHMYAPALRAIARQRAEHGRVLVFVRDASPDPTKPFFTAMYAHNLDGAFHGPVVVARDLGDADSVLVARYPGYVPFRLTSLTAEHNDGISSAFGFELVPLDGSVARAGRTLLGYRCCLDSTR